VQGKGVAALRQHGIVVEVGIEESAAKALNYGFFSRMQRQKPYVRAKMAMSLDGRTAMASKESQWITSEGARQDVQHWRGLSGAIITTAATVHHDNCRLTVRKGTPLFQPLRVVIATQGNVSPTAAIFQQPGKTLVALSANKIPKHSEFSYIALPEKENHIDINALFTYLAKEEQINEILIEAGPTFLGGLLKENVIDELLVYIAPKLLGQEAIPLAYLAPIASLKDCLQGELIACDKIGADCRLILKMNDFGKH
jgi:diaminohydroxyphosphoribosylaminopyrimidine deaminase/5-amino-6-(5-phosphoribosylamino)uracil reductase